MSDREFPRPYNNLAQRWRDLAERRRLHIVELYSSGRWRHYYSEEALVVGLREATRCVEAWDAILRARSPAAEQAVVEEHEKAVPAQPEPLQLLLEIVRKSDVEPSFLPQSHAA